MKFKSNYLGFWHLVYEINDAHVLRRYVNYDLDVRCLSKWVLWEIECYWGMLPESQPNSCPSLPRRSGVTIPRDFSSDQPISKFYTNSSIIEFLIAHQWYNERKTSAW